MGRTIEYNNKQSKQVVFWCPFIIMSLLVVGAAGLGAVATAATASGGAAAALALKEALESAAT